MNIMDYMALLLAKHAKKMKNLCMENTDLVKRK